MGNQIEVAAENDLSEGMMKAVSIEGQELLLARTQDGFYIISNLCPHMKGRLSKGKLEGNVVTCPRHGSQFDVRTGENIRWLKGKGVVSGITKIIKPPRAVKTFKVEIRNGKIFTEIP